MSLCSEHTESQTARFLANLEALDRRLSGEVVWVRSEIFRLVENVARVEGKLDGHLSTHATRPRPEPSA
jgi:hypothetical protein